MSKTHMQPVLITVEGGNVQTVHTDASIVILLNDLDNHKVGGQRYWQLEVGKLESLDADVAAQVAVLVANNPSQEPDHLAQRNALWDALEEILETPNVAMSHRLRQNALDAIEQCQREDEKAGPATVPNPPRCQHCHNVLAMVQTEDEGEGYGELDHWSTPAGCHEDCPACADEAEQAMQWLCINPQCPGNNDAMGTQENVETHFNAIDAMVDQYQADKKLP